MICQKNACIFSPPFVFVAALHFHHNKTPATVNPNNHGADTVAVFIHCSQTTDTVKRPSHAGYIVADFSPLKGGSYL